MTRTQKKMYMKLAKRVILQVSALRNIIGVQPMQAPVGLVYALQYTYKDEQGNTIEGSPETIPAPRRMSLEVKSNPIEAHTRKLQAAWNIEIAHDTGALHEVDFEEEFISILSSEVAHEIFNEAIHNLVKLSEVDTEDKVVFPAPIGNNSLMTLLIKINQQSNSIAVKTRRGAGNVLVTTPMVVSMFQMMNGHGITFKSPGKVSVSLEGLTHAGDIVSGPEESILYKVFMSMAPTLKKDDRDLILVLYKGQSGECDTGYIYAPFVPLLPTGVVLDPATFQPTCRLMTRNGMWYNYSPDTARASAYYRTIEVDMLGFLNQDPTSEANNFNLYP